MFAMNYLDLLEARRHLWNAWRHLRRYGDNESMSLLMEHAVMLTKEMHGENR